MSSANAADDALSPPPAAMAPAAGSPAAAAPGLGAGLESGAEAGAPSQLSDLPRRLLALTHIYRLLLPLLLLALQRLTGPDSTVGGAAPRLFAAFCAIYWVVAVLLAFGRRGRAPTRRALVLTHTLVDTTAISALLYASGGVSSGLGILLVFPVGAMALLAEGRGALGVAAIAALGLLAQQILAQLLGRTPEPDYSLAGILGAVLFLVALTAWPISIRLRESEALVRRQELDLANLAQLSQYIVQHLRESILVVDPSDRIRLINEAAAQMLGDTAAVPGALLGEVCPRLLYLLVGWRAAPGAQIPGEEPASFVAADGARVIRPHFVPLGGSEPSPILVFLEDTGLIAARVQQSKLAALGRLSASIAHEIRNPVGAISHAAQLLAESAQIRGEDRRLTDIMQANSTRVSGIIDNILQLSRREVPRPESLALAAWVDRLCAEFCATVQLPPEHLLVDPASEDVTIQIDGSQLHQIVWNLCQNALLHALPRSGTAPIELRYGRLGGVGRPYLEVADRGPGIPATDVERIFEPFYTRAARGTGLGLFLARELAQANRATLLYEPRESGGSLFRLVFADPGRWIDI